MITPNIPETEALTGMKIRGRKDMEQAARLLYQNWGCQVLCKGGHLPDSADDLLFTKEGALWIEGKKVDNPNTHGTGCTLSSAIASNLAKGYSMEDAVQKAKEYISGALAAMLDLGRGSGPMDHGFMLHKS